MSLKNELQSIATPELQAAFDGYHEKMASLLQEGARAEFRAEAAVPADGYLDLGRLVVGVSRKFNNPHDSDIALQAMAIFLGILTQVAETRDVPPVG